MKRFTQLSLERGDDRSAPSGTTMKPLAVALLVIGLHLAIASLAAIGPSGIQALR